MKTTSLELSKRLKAAGYPQGDVDFYWYSAAEDYKEVDYQPKNWKLAYQRLEFLGLFRENEVLAAPTAEEILDELPHYVGKRVRGVPYELSFNKHNGSWNIYYVTVKDDFLTTTVADTLAEAAGKMWLYLKQQRLL